MYASPNHVKIPGSKIPHQDTLRFIRRTPGRGEGEANHAALRSARLRRPRGYWGRGEGFTGRRDLVRHYAKRWQHVSFPRVTRSRSFLPPPAQPPGPRQSEEAFSPLHPGEPPYRRAPSVCRRPPPSPLARRGGEGPSLPPHARRGCVSVPALGDGPSRPPGPHLHPRQARLHGGVSHGGGGRDAGGGGSRVSSGGSRGQGLAHLHTLSLTHTESFSSSSSPFPRASSACAPAVGKGPSQARALSGPRHGCNGGDGLLIPPLPPPSPPPPTAARAGRQLLVRSRGALLARRRQTWGAGKGGRGGGGAGGGGNGSARARPASPTRLPARAAPPASRPSVAIGEGKGGRGERGGETPLSWRAGGPYLPRGTEPRRPGPEPRWRWLPGARLASSSGGGGGGAAAFAGCVGLRPFLAWPGRRGRPATCRAAFRRRRRRLREERLPRAGGEATQVKAGESIGRGGRWLQIRRAGWGGGWGWQKP